MQRPKVTLLVTPLLLVTILLPIACSAPQAEAPAGEAPTQASSAAPDLAPVSGRQDSSGPAIVAPGATFQLPAGWEWQTPSVTMRLAQAGVPGSAGPGQLTVFHFGPGGGGGVDANLQRWAGQVQPKEGSSPRRETFETGAFRVTWIDVAGTILPSTMGVGPTEPQPDSRLLAAVVEGNQGPWFFKLTGPDATLDAQREAFLGMLRGVRAREEIL